MKQVKKIAIIGGTHGNELTGVHLIQKFKMAPHLVKRESFETLVMHSNEKAIQACRRYIEKDLNRCFSIKGLADLSQNSYEDLLAKALNQKLGPKGSSTPKMDFIVDLHSTTSNMGLSVIIDNENELTWQVVAYLQQKMPQVKIFKWHGDTEETSFLHTVAPNGFAIEVGAVPQGVLRADLFFETEKLLSHLLDFFELLNCGKLKKFTETVEVYSNKCLVDFPRDKEGNITAMVHPDLQDTHYQMVQKGDPLFLSFEGEPIVYEQEETVYAVFVNEAAYYEKGFAMCLSRKERVALPS